MFKLEKEYLNSAEFQTDYEVNLKNGGLLLSSKLAVEVRAPAQVLVKILGKELATLHGEVVYASASEGEFQVGLALSGDWASILAKTLKQLPSEQSEEDDARWGKDSESVFHAVSKMDTHQKISLATKGGREERRILLKDAHHQVHPYVLKNPRLTTDEVSQIARMNSITGEMVLTIANNSDWMHNAAVRLAIIKNPKTPVPIVQKHIGHLNDTELIQIAKSEHVRSAVSQLARRVLAGRGKTVR